MRWDWVIRWAPTQIPSANVRTAPSAKTILFFFTDVFYPRLDRHAVCGGCSAEP